MMWAVAFTFSVITSRTLSSEVALSSALTDDVNISVAHVQFAHRLDSLQQLYVSEMSELASRVAQMEQICKTDAQNLTYIEREMMDMRSENRQLKERINSLELTLQYAQTEQSLRTRSFSRNKRAGSGTVAFHATMAGPMTNPSTNDIVVFSNLVTNIGSVQFSTTTGIYTCTNPGGHVFTWSVMVKGQHWVVTELVRNGASVGSSDTGDDLYAVSGSATVLVELAVGDRVWVRVSGHVSGADIYPVATTFTGFLI